MEFLKCYIVIQLLTHLAILLVFFVTEYLIPFLDKVIK